MKHILLVTLWLLYGLTSAQNLLSTDDSKVLTSTLRGDAPAWIDPGRVTTVRVIDSVIGLESRPYLIAQEASSLIVRQQNAGQITLVAKLFNMQDSIFHNPASKRQGVISFSALRNDQVIEDATMEVDFNRDYAQTIRYTMNHPNVDAVRIDFQSAGDQFLVEFISAVPLTEKGVELYTQWENLRKETQVFQSKIEANLDNLSAKHKDQLKQISDRYQNLTEVIIGTEFVTLESTRANSLNPFTNDDFLEHYESILKHAHESQRRKIVNTLEDIKKTKLTDMVQKVGSMAIGGSFSTLFGLVSGIFSNSFKWNGRTAIVAIDSIFYQQTGGRNDNVKFSKIGDDLLSKINAEKQKNKEFQTFITKVVSFTLEDINTISDMQAQLGVANLIKQDLAELSWEIIDKYSEDEKSTFVTEDKVDFIEISSQMATHFADRSIDLNSFEESTDHAESIHDKLGALKEKYRVVMDDIQSNYDQLYVERPDQRNGIFDELSGLAGIAKEWNKNQVEITKVFQEGAQKRFSEWLLIE
ncbi:MAG: hypothetical protein KTR24_02520 [Saprospiraceae bacterium]|nr:hypothetical protein [Saprospiraceae bacterium]